MLLAVQGSTSCLSPAVAACTDDAGATEVALLLDEEQYPCNSILGAASTPVSFGVRQVFLA